MSNDSWQDRRDSGLTKQLVEQREKADLKDYESLILFDSGAFKAMLRAADFGYAEGRKDERENAKDCKHPGCCCVCGHKGKCPECGPIESLVPASSDQEENEILIVFNQSWKER